MFRGKNGQRIATMSADSTLIKRVENLLVHNGSEPANLLQVLELVLAHFNCATGTIHALDHKSGLLVLLAQRGIPEVIMDKVARIPVGKGMAGIAAERKQPVQVCNLQSDASGVAKPGAKETRMEGSVAVPMLVDSTILRGVLGVAKPVAYEFTPAELETLSAIAALIGKHLGRPTKTELLDHVWDAALDTAPNAVEVYVGYLRRKIGRDRLETVRGAGYRLAAVA